jgi:hypothetical protein
VSIKRVRLTCKFAQCLNGIDLSQVSAGDEIEVSTRDAEMLIAEGWAAPVAEADDRPPPRRRAHKTPPDS